MSSIIRRSLAPCLLALLCAAPFQSAQAVPSIGLESPQQGLIINTVEDGDEARYLFRLTDAPEPGETVTVSASTDDPTEGTIGSPSQTFDASNWNVYRALEIQPGASSDGNDGDVQYRITLEISSTGGVFSSLPNVEVDVSNANIDGTAKILLESQADTIGSNSAQFFAFEDDGVIFSGTTFEVTTSSTPSAEVVIPVIAPGGSDLVVFPSEIRLNSSNGFTGQLYVQGAIDQLLDPDVVATLVGFGSTTSTDPSFDGLSTPDLQGFVIDLNDQLSGQLSGLADGNSVQVRVSYAPFDPCATAERGAVCKVTEAGSETLTLSANGSFGFSPIFFLFDSITVDVVAPPSGPVAQTCSTTQTEVDGPSEIQGALAAIAVTCTTVEYTVGGQVSGLNGSGLVLQNNAGDNLSISGNGPFTFPTALADGSSYDVSVLSNPSNLSQTCSVGRLGFGKGTINPGSGVIGGANITDIAITCTTNSFTIGGQVSGLVGSGLVLQNNGGDDLAVSANGGFTFATPLVDGSSYNVSVAVQPSNPAQTCSLPMPGSPRKGFAPLGSGTLMGANVSNIPVSCVTDATAPGAPTNVQVQVNGTQTTVTWTPPANDGGSAITQYTVTLTPGGRTCTVTGNPPPTQCVFDNLAPGSYTANVVASNAVGGGAPGTGSGGTVSPAVIPAGSPASLALLIALFGLLGAIFLVRRQH